MFGLQSVCFFDGKCIWKTAFIGDADHQFMIVADQSGVYFQRIIDELFYPLRTTIKRVAGILNKALVNNGVAGIAIAAFTSEYEGSDWMIFIGND